MADEMVPGGVWLSEGGGTGTPHYVVNPDHIARLQSEGYQIVDTSNTVEEKKHDDTNGRLAAIKPAHKSRKGSVDTTV